MDFNQSAQAPPSYNSFANYDPTRDAEELARKDSEVAEQNRLHLQRIIGGILHDQKRYLSRQDLSVLETWKDDILSALGNGEEWNLYHEENWDKIERRFTEIRNGRWSLSRMRRKPFTLVENGKLVGNFVPAKLVEDLKLETPVVGRRRIFKNLLCGITLAFQSQMVDVNKFTRRWRDPLKSAVKRDLTNFAATDKWYKIVAVLEEIAKDQMRCNSRYLTDRSCTYLKHFEQEHPVDQVLLKMGIPASRILNSINHHVDRFGSRRRQIYGMDCDSDDGAGSF
ncbi:hypothetical protein JCM3765_002369 [Sporobolomyces pararoseus]